MPKVVGKYELYKTLGEGSYGKVKYAVNLETQEAVAIKILDKKKIQQQNMGKQIKKEIAVLKSIGQHKHVVAIKDVFATSTKIFIVLELVDGGELFEYLLERKRLPEMEARRLFSQLLDGLSFCHSNGIFHRDLKPENLLLDGDGNIKISDFGLSTLYVGSNDEAGPPVAGEMDRIELLHTTCGTPNYVAPEVLENRGYDGRTADVWSVGVILFVLLAGYLPFEEDTMPALFEKIKRAEFQLPPVDTTSVSTVASTSEREQGKEGKDTLEQSSNLANNNNTPTGTPKVSLSGVCLSPSARDLLSKILVADPQERLTMEQILASEWMQGPVTSDASTLLHKSLSKNKGKGVSAPDNVPAGNENQNENNQSISPIHSGNSQNNKNSMSNINSNSSSVGPLSPRREALREQKGIAVSSGGVNSNSSTTTGTGSATSAGVMPPAPPKEGGGGEEEEDDEGTSLHLSPLGKRRGLKVGLSVQIESPVPNNNLSSSDSGVTFGFESETCALEAKELVSDDNKGNESTVLAADVHTPAVCCTIA